MTTIERSTNPTRTVPLPLLVVMVLAAVAAAVWFVARPSVGAVTWATGEAQVTGTQATIESDGRTYGLSGSVAEWTDEAGATNQLTWPTCLADGATAPVRFGWVTYGDGGDNGRVVVAVDCRR